MSQDRIADASTHESAMKAEPEARRDATRDRPARLEGVAAGAKASAGAKAGAPGHAISGAIGNGTLASLMGQTGGGRALPPMLRAQLEQALGTSLGDVRVHDDSAARAAADSVDAQAFTHGRDIYLGAAANEDASLLAHEVMHVEQQRHASAIEARVSAPGEAAEMGADHGAAQALGGQRASVSRGGAVAGVQRQPTGGQTGVPPVSPNAPTGLGITKRMEITRDIAQAALYGFLQRNQNVTTAVDLRQSSVVKTALQTLANTAGGSAAYIKVDKFLASVPNDPAEIARRFAQLLPPIVNVEALEALNALVAQDTPPTKGQRIGNLVKKTAPGETTPDATNPPPAPRDIGKDADNDILLNQRRQGGPDPTTKGPFSVDVLRVGRIIAGFGQASKGQPQRQKSPEARSTDAIKEAVGSIANDALVPAEARGTKDADNFAGASQFAHDLASKIDIALQKNLETVGLELGASFATVKDRAALIQAVEAIIQIIRAAFPNNAAAVVNIDIKVGGRYITRGRVR